MATVLTTVAEYEEQASRILPKHVFDYYIMSKGDGQTFRDNMAAFSRLRLLPRLMTGNSVQDLSTSILGQQIAFPVVIGPTAKHCLAHPDGEIATAKAAACMKTGMVLSSWSTKSMEDVALATPGLPRWLQMTNYKDSEMVVDMLRRAERNGYKGIVLTSDTPFAVSNFATHKCLPNSLRYENFRPYVRSEEELGSDDLQVKFKGLSLTWDYIDWLKSVTSLPIIVKGITTARDARTAVKHKADAILVSNHGGRVLDGLPATIDALPDVVNAVRGSGVEVYLDGGIRTGTDVFKAIALGAKAVFIGRPALWGLACGGEAGVKHVLEILREELDNVTTVMGCENLADITPDLIRMQVTSNL